MTADQCAAVPGDYLHSFVVTGPYGHDGRPMPPCDAFGYVAGGKRGTSHGRQHDVGREATRLPASG